MLQDYLISPNTLKVIKFTLFNANREPIKYREVFKGTESEVHKYILENYSSDIMRIAAKQVAVISSESKDHNNIPIHVSILNWLSHYDDLMASNQWIKNIDEAVQNTHPLILETDHPLCFF